MKYKPMTPSQFDRMAHQIMEYLADIRPVYGSNDGGESKGRIFYNEGGLYTIHDLENGVVTMVYADSPRDAKEKIDAIREGVNKSGNEQ